MEHNLAKAKHRELSWILISKVSHIEILINILLQLPRARSEHSIYLCVVKLTITSNHSSYTSKRLFKFPTFIYPTYCTERSESKTLENQISSVLLTMRRPHFKEVPQLLFSQFLFQMVGKEPFLSLLTAPSTWTETIQRNLVLNCFEQTVKRPSGLKCA